ncbi:MAG TPA: hypothetical protein EYF98_15365 [Planctomycetes bacterium]|nr:hypothetical protein [Planctomycetota bacterium]
MSGMNSLCLSLTIVLATAIQAEAAQEATPGPRWISADGRSELILEGLFQVNGAVVDEGRSPRANLGLQRMRPELAGRFADSLHFRVEPNFAAEGVELEEAWIGMEVRAKRALLMAGRMKVPFGLEEVRSRRHINFTRFSILNQFSPAEEHGLFLNGKNNSGRWEYGVSATDGVESGDSDASVNLAGRIMLHPRAQEPTSRWRNLQLGLAVTTGSLNADASDLSVQNAAGRDVIQMAGGVQLDGNRTRLGFEAAWFDGPWFVQAEHMLVEQGMRAGGGVEDVEFSGSYLEVARVLTGESKSFKGVTPDQSFDPATGSGRGAWILAARISELNSDQLLQSEGLAATGTYTSAIWNFSLGLNWVMNRHMVLRQALVRSVYSDDVFVDGEARSGESALMFGLQLHF